MIYLLFLLVPLVGYDLWLWLFLDIFILFVIFIHKPLYGYQTFKGKIRYGNTSIGELMAASDVNPTISLK